MKILSVASALPPRIYSQQEITAALMRIWADQLPKPALLQRLHANCGVSNRHLTLDIDHYEKMTGFGDANTRWIEAAVEFGGEAVRKAVAAAGLAMEDLGAIFFVSVTGIANPSVDARLVNTLGLSRNIKRIPIFGLGCVAGAAGLARTADYVRAFPKQYAVLLSVELCSLNWQFGDASTANMIATGLFGDGAAAVILAGDKTPQEAMTPPGTALRVIDTRSVFYPGTEDTMGWDISEDGFRILLSPNVPEVIKANLRGDMDAFLADHGLTRSDIASWIVHTGGPKVLQAIETTLELPPDALKASWNSLNNIGNLSSASVLMILEETLRENRQPAGSYSVLSAMGPGFCSEFLLLQW